MAREYMSMTYQDYEVPKSVIDAIRNYMGDTPERNRLIDGTEMSDSQIRMAIQMFVDNFNNSPPKIDQSFTVHTFPNALLMFRGVVLELLRMSSIYDARNSIDFQDAGLAISTGSKAAVYEQIASNLEQWVMNKLEEVKTALNAEEGYGILHSPENRFYRDYNANNNV